MGGRFKNDADWRDIAMVSTDVGARGLKVNQGMKPLYEHNGYLYCTETELKLAIMLDEMGIPNTPDVLMPLTQQNGRPRIFVPDVVFNGRVYFWRGENQRLPIHGFEAKGYGAFSKLAQENVRFLNEQKRINILLISRPQVDRYYDRFFTQKRSRRPLPLYELELIESARR